MNKYIPCKYKCNFHGKKCNSDQKWNKQLCLRECKSPRKHNARASTCKSCKYLKSIIRDSVILCDEIIELTKTFPTKTTSTKTVPTSFKEKKITCKIKNFYILLTFLLILT